MTALVGNNTRQSRRHCASKRPGLGDAFLNNRARKQNVRSAASFGINLPSLSSPWRVCAVAFTNTSAGLQRRRGWPEDLLGRRRSSAGHFLRRRKKKKEKWICGGL